MNMTMQGPEEESTGTMKEEETPKLMNTLITLRVEIRSCNLENENIVREQP